MNVRSLLILLTAVCFAACDREPTAQSRGPIILGDSSTIVTETDPKALQDLVPDLQPPGGTDNGADMPAADTATPTTAVAATPAPAAAAPVGNGLSVSFKEVTLSIPGITTRSYGRPDLQKARSATYELTGGKLAGARLQVSGGTPTKVTQRYETIIVVEKGNEHLPLESLGKHTSAWQTLSGSRGSYLIAGLEPSRLGFKQATPAAIRNAVQQAARKKRLSRQDTQEWLNAVKNIRAANQAPAAVALRSVSWRVEGKDAAGKSFSKELRIDVPLP